MKYKEKLKFLYLKMDKKYKEQFGFSLKETSFTNLTDYLHVPKDASSLAVTRILFGLSMLFDIPDERGGAIMYKRWGDPKTCHFPLFNSIQAIPMPYMTLVYAALWLGALGIMLGYKFRTSVIMFTICYWYLFLIEKSFWNNHSYLFGLVAFLLTFTEANCYWSLDAILEPTLFSETVPYWNYFLLKYQFFILYFMAGVKKGTAEWLTGYSVLNLSSHWVFTPFTFFLTVAQTDYLIVHWFIFLFDLTVAMWMMWSQSRHLAMIFCALFHLMNTRLFSIGMFPWVCLATMPLFYPFDWPKIVMRFIRNWFKIDKKINSMMTDEGTVENDKNNTEDCHDDVFLKDGDIQNINDPKDIQAETSFINKKIYKIKETSEMAATKRNKVVSKNGLNSTNKNEVQVKNNIRKKITTMLIIIHVAIQSFLPFSHFITKGYNNWTNGLYGYSWDMMVHTWDVQSVVLKIVDNEKNIQFYIDPNVYAPNDRWFKHGDIVYQYAKCLQKRLLEESIGRNKNGDRLLSNNISIYVDVWCSMNGRFTQRMFDPDVDLLNATWSPFEVVPFLMPLLDEASHWRSTLDEIRNEVYSWGEHIHVLFFVDFPGYSLEKFIPAELHNVTLTVLEGSVAFEQEVTKTFNGQSYKLPKGHGIKVNSGTLHTVLNIGNVPAFYMYTFFNNTEKGENVFSDVPKPKLPVLNELKGRFTNMGIFGKNIFEGIYQTFFRLWMFLV